MSEPVISVRGLRKSYDGNEAVRGIDLEVDSGEVFAFLGPNGADKNPSFGPLRVRRGPALLVEVALDDDAGSPPETAKPEFALQLKRSFKAPRKAVFDAWTNPEVLRRWWASQPDWEAASAEVDLRVGGRYRLSQREPSGAIHTVGGEYAEVRCPERLAYTWAWEPEADDAQAAATTHVTVEFVDDGDHTTVVVTQRGFDSQASAERHEHGWSGCLDNPASRVFAEAGAGGR